jgi:hypothetical protein
MHLTPSPILSLLSHVIFNHVSIKQDFGFLTIHYFRIILYYVTKVDDVKRKEKKTAK